MHSLLRIVVSATLTTLITTPTLILTSAIKLRSAPNIPLSKRADGNSSISLNSQANTQYLADISIGGAPFNVIIDTGSSDLWIAGKVPQTTNLDVPTTLTYAVGSAGGYVNSAPVEFAGHSISNQAYLLVNDTTTFNSGFSKSGIDGLIGLGPGQGSVILGQVGNSSGDPVLDRIFQKNVSSSNFISFTLQREKDDTSVVGELTVGSIIPGFENITNQPKLPVEHLTNDSAVNQHWTVHLDSDGIFGPDGQVIEKSSIVPDNGGRLYAILDSGFTFPQVPRSVSDAIYGRVKGANWSDTENLWTIPCDQELNISFSIGGIKYPVHPLDVSMSEFQLKDANGNTVCVGSFQPITSAFSLAGQFDLILGMSFLRNTYALMNFGSFVQGSNSSQSPYVQLMSVTNPADAHADFVKARLGGVDTTGSSQYALLPESEGQSSPIPLDERVKHAEQKVIRYLPAIIVCSLAGFGLILAFGIWKYMQIRRRRRNLEQKQSTMHFGDSPVKQKYAELQDYGYGGGGGGDRHLSYQMQGMNRGSYQTYQRPFEGYAH